jgi:hypothetical protein
MNRVTIDLENCYGIKKLRHEFDFSQSRVYAIYAPNGVMKTSLAQTFKDLADNEISKDRMFGKRISSRKITDEKGNELKRESVLVLPPYDEFFGNVEKTATLLVNKALRQEYEALNSELDKSKKVFLDAMRQQSKSKKELESEIAIAFTKTAGNDAFYLALERANLELVEQKDAPFSDVKYDIIFDDKVLTALAAKEVRNAIAEYVNRYNILLDASTYFKKGVFEYYNGAQIAKSLADNGFFSAKHVVVFNAAKKLEIATEKDLQKFIDKELEQIAQDVQLRTTFAVIKKAFEKNAALRDFHTYICNREPLVAHLSNPDLLKEKIWRSYFMVNRTLFDDLLGQYRKVKARRKEIEEQARQESTQWEAAIRLFNDRFFVPFVLEAKNKAYAVCGHADVLDLTYTFKDGAESVSVSRDNLVRVLSQGEKKALYILNIIFEIELRRQRKQETLFVVDDIADSFDYRNKYAIVQYLKDIGKDPLIKQIIMTHNFDFFRTLESRNVARYPECLMASRNDAGVISLDQAQGIKNVFLFDLKKEFFKDHKKKVACIPFIRNLVEVSRGLDDPQYIRLTSLLHWKPDTPAITEADLDAIYNAMFSPSGKSANGKKPMIDVIHKQASSCLIAKAGVNFENKIVLAIAIRLASEKFMVARINDAAFVNSITSDQTAVLVEKFKELFGTETSTIAVLENVALMTPENIHLNSFMYEPIVDMSDEHLRKLYSGILALK